jgi:RHS repeat-associated protein
MGTDEGNSQQYTARENDKTGVIFYRWRYYMPQTGRFISEDPTGFAGGPNLYGYAGGNPIEFNDPQGDLYGCSAGSCCTATKSSNTTCTCYYANNTSGTPACYFKKNDPKPPEECDPNEPKFNCGDSCGAAGAGNPPENGFTQTDCPSFFSFVSKWQSTPCP